MITFFKKFLPFISLLFFIGCATYRPQKLKGIEAKTSNSKNVNHTFYLVGGYGNQKNDQLSPKLQKLLTDELSKASENSTLLFLGDNISKEKDQKQKDFKLLDQQLSFANTFEGQSYFLHGVNEWKDNAIDQLEEYEDYVEKKNKTIAAFENKNGCPLEHIVINDQLDMIIVNSHWFITNWDRVEEINKKCTNITTRRRFIEELEGYINDAQDKNIVIAMHHPIFSNGTYNGHETFQSHLLPLPVLGTVLGEIKDLASISRSQLDFPRYRALRIMVSALAQKSDRVTVVSAHEESLQYLSGGGIHQIISGSFGNAKATHRDAGYIHAPGGTLKYKGQFTYGEPGYTKLEFYDDGSSSVHFVTAAETSKDRYEFSVLPPFQTYDDYNFNTANYPKEKKAVIIEDAAQLEKSGFFKWLWGDRYREYFNKEVTAPVAMLDTLYGGLTVLKKGGGHQSNSLRLVDSENREYAMRSLKKEALKFLTQKIQGIAYSQDDYEETLTEDLVSDFFTTAHPFMQMVINDLAEEVDINHSDSRLFYVPKQNQLGEFNASFGDELYYIERRPSDEQKAYEGYSRANPDEPGKISDFESTTDVLEKLKEDEKYKVDQKAYIRARIFDMLIGDWDRHQDQWRWVEYEKDEDDKLFIPVPRDRDNTFTKFDGVAIPFIKIFSPPTRPWQTYGPEIKNLKWFNAEGNNLDQTFITKYGVQTWIDEAKYIKENLSEAAIDQAFTNLPVEVQDETSKEIREHLKQRLDKIDEYAREYAVYLNKNAVVTGTHKDDIFEIIRMPEGKTKVVVKRKLSGEENQVFFERTYDKKETKQILIYGLNDDDIFKVSGEGEDYVKIKIIGGYGKDIYEIENRSRIKVYDWKHEASEFKDKKPGTQMTNLYETNMFHWRYFQENYNIVMPTVGFLNDNGFFVGLSDTYVKTGLHSDGGDFEQKHMFKGNYFVSFQGFELGYQGTFANIFPNWNLTLNGYFSNDQFVQNFFGFGNETENLEDELDLDFNRAQIQQIKIDAKINYRSLYVKGLFESFKVDENPDRFLTSDNVNPLVFDNQSYVGAEAGFTYDRKNALDFPTKALLISLQGGYKKNIDISDNEFGYLSFALGGSHELISSGHVVLSSKAEVKTNFGDNYLFYHAPTIGGINGLRGFRNRRFTGDTYFYQSSDLKFRVKRFVTSVFPLTFGTYGGFDYGRVWVDDEDSDQWHTSLGGGVWLSGAESFTFRAGMFGSDEGVQIQAGFGFAF